MFLRQHDLGHGAPVDGEGLEELRAGAHRLRVLNYDPDGPTAGAVGDLDPVPAHTCQEVWKGPFE